MNGRERIILALDVDDFGEAERLVREFRDSVGMFKVGKQVFTAYGTRIVEYIKGEGGRVFLDLKYHDIPNTVSKAAVEAAKLGVDMFNVHASGGFTMMHEAQTALRKTADSLHIVRPTIIGVTVLTSIDDAELARIGIGLTAKEFTRRLALLAKEAGLDGVVASGLEIAMIREVCGADFVIVTPGVRITQTKDDQKRTIGPAEAIAAGATYIVLGRTVLTTEDPHATLKAIGGQIDDVLARQQK
jgi:orotidine-5'-phosphate decarboxylase